jgi:hypothetical protein
MSAVTDVAAVTIVTGVTAVSRTSQGVSRQSRRPDSHVVTINGGKRSRIA